MNKNASESRRNFLVQCSGIFAGLLAPISAGAANPKHRLQALLHTMEQEALQFGKPLRNESGNIDPVKAITLNPTAEQVWRACNGARTPSDIARMLCDRFAVSYPRAYADTLCFLVELKNRNLIRLQ